MKDTQIIANYERRIQLIVLLVILSLAAFLRLYRIKELTEFLGDQGRTGIHIYQAWTTKTLPLVGPTVLSGQHLGPAFYYLIAPFFILGGFAPVWPAVGTALFGVGTVALLWWWLKELFNWRIASLVSLLYAVSPAIVAADRTLWEPNLVPFFATLYLVCLQIVRSNPRRLDTAFLLGVTIGILVQLHYPNIIFVLLTFIFYGYLLILRKLSGRTLLLSLLLVIFGSVLMLAPFIYYEATHNFENISGVARIMFTSGSAPLGKRVWLWNVIDYSLRVFGRVFPVSHSLTGILLVIIALGVVIRKDFWLRFLALWWFVGIGAMALYRGVVYDHYLYFITPVPFLLLGYLLSLTSQKISIILLTVVVGILSFFSISRLDLWRRGVNDIARTREAVDKVIELAHDDPFSFTLVKSRSFSDLHYRYFWETGGIKSRSLTGDDYQLLFLVCDGVECPAWESLTSYGKVAALCYEDHCRGPYPSIDLSKWKLVGSAYLSESTVYQLARRAK